MPEFVAQPKSVSNAAKVIIFRIFNFLLSVYLPRLISCKFYS